jgi:predicted polyphosphate/ATP-dependent NAD kinase
MVFQRSYHIPLRFSIVIVGLVINPVAGMGGSVALKGTDGEAYCQAVARGAVPLAGGRALRALSRISDHIVFLTASGDLGEKVLGDLGHPFEVVHSVKGMSSGIDTRKACSAFVERGTGLILFCGGDGTARDVLDAVGEAVPVIGIPAGVKMHSAVFANTPEEAGEAVNTFLSGEKGTRLAEVMDIDESAFRSGELKARLYGYMRVPELGSMQPPKGSVFATSDDEQKEAIAEFVVEGMEPGVIYILGPGTTTRAVAARMGQPKTLLGVDAYLDHTLLLSDASEVQLLETIKGRRARLIVTPIGRQGFVLGRGNQQISPKVVEAVGLDNLQVIATPGKLKETPTLRSDSGDPALDRRMSGFRRVLVGFSQFRMVRCA